MSLESLGYGPYFSAQLELLNRPELVPARVVSDGQTLFHLGGARAPLGELSGKLRQGLTPSGGGARKGAVRDSSVGLEATAHGPMPLERPVAGDWVAIADDAERAVIHHVLERRTAMIRRAAGSASSAQVVAANVDVFFVVTSANRDLNVRRIERYLAAVWSSGARPVIVLNKIDLGSDPAALTAELGPAALGVPVVPVSAMTGEGMDELRAHIALGATVGFVGSSGVGKSSLINRLLGREMQEVRELRADERGRHTTTRRELIEVPGLGVLLDTPGMRELGLVADDGGIEAGFADVAELAERCRFGDCRHAGEPGCAVAEAVARGELDEARLASYHKLQREVAAAERLRDPAIASQTKRRWRSIAKAMRARSKLDPKQRR